MATHIRETLDKFLKQKKQTIDDLERIKANLDNKLEAALKRHINLEGVYRDKLIFSSDCSSSAYELNLKKKEIIAIAKRELPQIKDIKITVRT